MNFPRITVDSVKGLTQLVNFYRQNPDLLKSQSCPYTETLKDELKVFFKELTSEQAGTVLMATLMPVVEVPQIPEDVGVMDSEQLLKVIDRAVRTLEKVMQESEGSEASKVSASKAVFDLIQKRTELVSKMGDVDAVWKYQALIKEFFNRAPDKRLANEFLQRLKELSNE